MGKEGRLTMGGEIHKALKVTMKLINPKIMKDQSVPRSVMRNAKGIAFITVIKAGFGFSGTVGAGIVIARLPNGEWSGPSSLGVGGMGWGLMIGATATDSVIVLNTDAAVKAFSSKGQLKFGGAVSIAAGPVGRELDTSGYLGSKGAAACYSYSHSRGLFAGISLEGAIIGTRDKDNARFYGRPVSASVILKGGVKPPHHADLLRLVELLSTFEGGYAPGSGTGFVGGSAAAEGSGSAKSWGGAAQAQGYNPHTSELGGYAEKREERAAAAAAAPATAQRQLPPGWEEILTPKGEPYYYHPDVGTQWEFPEGAASGATSAANTSIDKEFEDLWSSPTTTTTTTTNTKDPFANW